MIFSTNAIVLNYRKFSDTSLICNLYSKDYGKFSIIAKGARSLKNPHGAILQPLNYIDIVYYYKEKRSMQLLKEATIKKKYYNISENYEKMIYALTIVDIVNFSSYNDSPCHIIFRLITKSLDYFNSSQLSDLDYYYLFFNIQLLIYLGYHPIIEGCYNCNNKIKTAIFDVKTGHLYCKNCCNQKFIINENEILLMQLLSKTHIKNLKDYFTTSQKSLLNIKKYLFKFILYHIPELKNSKSFMSFNLNSTL